MDDDRSRLKPVLVGLGALVAGALVIGGLVGALAWGAVNLAGDGPNLSTAPTGPLIPERSETAGPQPKQVKQGKDGSSNKQKSANKKNKTNKNKKQSKKNGRITLDASPKVASTYQRVNLTGRYPGGNGTTLTVQRRQGGWADFPTSATVRGGSFSTYVQTGRAGVNRFRVVDQSTGKKSKPVSVIIR